MNNEDPYLSRALAQIATAAQQIAEAVRSIQQPQNAQQLTLHEFIRSRLSTLAPSTRTSHERTLALLQQHGPVDINALTYTWVSSFDDLLQQKGYATSTIHRHHRTLKRWINQAVREEIIEHRDNPYTRYQVKRGKGRKVFLSADEVALMESAPQSEARDMFLFACYTGLRYSDLVNLSPDSFHVDGDKVYITVVQVKTGDRVVIPVHKLPDYDKIMLLPYQFTLSNADLNKQLKQIAASVGIKKNISIHVDGLMAERYTGTTLSAHLSQNRRMPRYHLSGYSSVCPPRQPILLLAWTITRSSATEGTLPATTNSLSIARAGVETSPRSTITSMLVIFTTSAFRPSWFSTFFTLASSLLHFGHPAPNTSIFIPSFPLASEEFLQKLK